MSDRAASNANDPDAGSAQAQPVSNRIDHTHDPDLRSWVASANDADTDFPIQNLPFGRFRRADDPADAPLRIGVAIGDRILGLSQAGLIDHDDMARLMALPVAERRALRHRLSAGLREGSSEQSRWSAALLPQSRAVMALPCAIGDYTDFYVGIHHATAIGSLFRPDNPLLPNYRWVPIGYHGRASTIGVSGNDFPRPCGQTRAADAAQPVYGPSRRLDFELELAVFVGRPSAAGTPVAMADAEDHVFGLALFNDWSARDLQAWEYQPLGPFLSKNFASTVSPWIVTMEALAPFRRPFARPAGDPEPLPYLDSAHNRTQGQVDVELEVWLQSAAMREAGIDGALLSRSNYADAAYWTLAQMIAHHSANGCQLRTGDLLGTGTLSGPQPEQAGSLMELTRAGRQPLQLPGGEQRDFLADGDSITLRGRCRRDGARSIGFGICRAQVLPARAVLPG